MRRVGLWVADWGPILVLAVIAAAGSFTHIRDQAEKSGQLGWMAWAIAISIDLTCVMAARERHRDLRLGRVRRGWVSYPTLVLAGGVVLTLAANLATAQPTVWGWIMAATSPAAFLVAVSMLERRAMAAHTPVPASAAVPVAEPSAGWQVEEEAVDPPAVESADPLAAYAAQVAAEHRARTGEPITVAALRHRLGVAEPVATRLLRQMT